MLNPIEEARHDELKKMCAELKVPAPPEIFIRFQVHDKDGKLVFNDRQRGHSWTRNFYNSLFSMSSYAKGDGSGSFGAGYMSSKILAGNIYSAATKGCGADDQTDSHGYKGATGDVTKGIIVGTGDTAFSAEQFVLVSPIAEGVGSGKFSYQAVIVSSAYTGGTKTWKTTLSRIMNNNSGGSITVKETGLYYYGYASLYKSFFGSGNSSFMLERSVLDPTVAVANGAQLTVTYEISMDFSAID